MKAAHPSLWFQKGNKKSQAQERYPSSQFLSSSSSSRQTPPSNPFNPFHLNLFKDPQRPSSSASTRSAYTNPSANHRPTILVQDLHTHPFATMVHAPLPVVSSHDSSEEEEECPVCLEPLSFSFRLPGEKPHIVPECGHALHEVSRFHSHLAEICVDQPPPLYGNNFPSAIHVVVFTALSPLVFPLLHRRLFACQSYLALCHVRFVPQ
jgi:hypothetical protein